MAATDMPMATMQLKVAFILTAGCWERAILLSGGLEGRTFCRGGRPQSGLAEVKRQVWREV